MARTELSIDDLSRDFAGFTGSVRARYDRAVVDPVLTELSDLWTDSWVGLRTTTKPRRESSLRMLCGPGENPIDRLVDANLLKLDDHRISALVSDLRSLGPIEQGVDLESTRGVEKVWLCFREPVSSDDLLGLATLPQSIYDHRVHLAKQTGRIGAVGVNLTEKSINVYSIVEGEDLGTGDVAEILGQTGISPPGDDELTVNTQAFRIYRTFGWDAPDMRRICFATRFLAEDLPVRLHPDLASIAAVTPFADGNLRDFNFYTSYGPAGHYYKVQAMYRFKEQLFYKSRT
ncbi:aromatic prenyltransferase [Kitasatospora sp. NPDC008115]|uniref:aromatic prenyltransferase n=1 Tax=Kitasatospora sp. NPDC008115 TaxID=3364022 RepID=UPI0036E7A8BC